MQREFIDNRQRNCVLELELQSLSLSLSLRPHYSKMHMPLISQNNLLCTGTLELLA